MRPRDLAKLQDIRIHRTFFVARGRPVRAEVPPLHRLAIVYQTKRGTMYVIEPDPELEGALAFRRVFA